MKIILPIVIVVGFLVMAGPGRCEETRPELKAESSAEARLQTHIYRDMNEETFIPLCVEFLEREGYTLSVVVREFGVIRAWTGEDVFDAAENAGKEVLGVFLPVDTAVDLEKRRAVVLTTNDTPEGLRVRAQFTYRMYDERWQLSGQGAIPEADMYREFFGKLDQAVSAADKG